MFGTEHQGKNRKIIKMTILPHPNQIMDRHMVHFVLQIMIRGTSLVQITAIKVDDFAFGAISCK